MSGFGGLLAAELRRFSSRRLFRGLAIAFGALLLLQLGTVFFDSSKDPTSGLREAEAEVEQCRRYANVQDEEFGGRVLCPSVEEIRGQYDKRFRYAETIDDVFGGIGILFIAVGLVAGGSFVGAEWGTGSMATLLTWEPRRGRVLGAKFLACAIAVAATLAVTLLLVALLFYPVGVLRGTTEGATRSFWWSQAGAAVRDIGLGLFGVTIGVSFATFFRSTAGAVGAGFFYGTIADGLLSVWRDGVLRDWLLRENIARLLGQTTAAPDFDAMGRVISVQPSAVRPAIVLTVYAAAFLAASYAFFRRRDVT